MKEKNLQQQDLFLYEFAIRMLAVLATVLFSLLFFYGAVASDNTDYDTKANGKVKAEYSSILEREK